MPNCSRIIKGHNSKILDDALQKIAENERKHQCSGKKKRGRPRIIETKLCTCNSTHPCPLDGKCNVSEVIYRADILENNESTWYYIGQTMNPFKERWSNHNSTFNNRNTNQHCYLKDKIWELQDNGVDFTVKWKIIRKSKAYRPGDSGCRLCLDEKLAILDNWGDPKLLNKDKMIMAPCLHKPKFKINNIVETEQPKFLRVEVEGIKINDYKRLAKPVVLLKRENTVVQDTVFKVPTVGRIRKQNRKYFNDDMVN